eukprot:gb/GECH01013119.1/.p1 GENE.gb/GECH01013119.1/~~gb/GECH01013119.1/.p1  ORF type:complete len:907 (+),score=235.75 gb/GECH01013119.1/:1-2721(+)
MAKKEEDPQVRSLKKKKRKPDYDEINDNFKVVIRVRPPLKRELEAEEKPFVNVVRVDPDERGVTVSEHLDSEAEAYNSHHFAFDRVYAPKTSQQEVYKTTARPAVLSMLEGYNATIFAYGQTGTGKTYSMEGFTSEEQRGIIPRASEEIFNYIENCTNPNIKFLVRASYLQIYNEVISDLLKPERKHLNIREDKKKGVFVEGLSEWVVRSPEEIYGLMERGARVRATGSTSVNELSSRSHAVFIIIAEQSETTFLTEEGREMEVEEVQSMMRRQDGAAALANREVRQSFKIGKLNLVDLAGSERVRYTGATGVRLEESKKINQSLSALGNVIAALTDPKARSHIPYRDSKLTRLLEDSLGGNCKTTMMAMITPAWECFSESLSTVKFANRAKNIKNEAHINEDLDQRALLRKYEKELKKLRSELAERSKTVVDKRRMLELEEQKKRAEQDKLAAITALEKRSEEFLQEKADKQKLEEKISRMQGQLLIGGGNEEETVAFRNALQKEFDKVHKQYLDKLSELEKERQTIEEDKAQVDRYKQLLVKQRDIMIALTARLNERDESILGLQEELDAYDRHQRMLEDALDKKTAQLIHYQKIAMEMEDGEVPQDAFPPTPTGENNQNNASDSRRYQPYEQQVVFRGQNSENLGTLSADEKVQELSKIIEEKDREIREIDSRSSRSSRQQKRKQSPRNDNNRKQLQSQVDVLKSQNSQFRSEMASKLEEKNATIKALQEQLSNVNSQNDTDSPDLKKLENQLSLATNERNAIKMILESRIKTMVENISRSLDEIATGEQNIGRSNIRTETETLKTIVGAAIKALEDSDAMFPTTEDSDSSSSSSQPSSPRVRSRPSSPNASQNKPKKTKQQGSNPKALQDNVANSLRKSQSSRQIVEELLRQRKESKNTKYQ